MQLTFVTVHTQLTDTDLGVVQLAFVTDNFLSLFLMQQNQPVIILSRPQVGTLGCRVLP